MAVTRLAYQLQAGHNYIDLAQGLAIVHRNSAKNMFRQKKIYTVLGGMVVNNNQNAASQVSVATIPNTWYFKAAINRGFKAWKAQRARTLANTATEDAKMAVGKYADFKVKYNSAGAGNYLIPIAAGTHSSRGNLATGEWQHSDLVDETAPAAGAQKVLNVLGDHTAGAYALMKGWVETRQIPHVEDDPAMPDLNSDGVKDYKVDFINNLNETEDGQPERLTLLYEENDQAPYHVSDVYHDLDDDFNDCLQAYSITNPTSPSAMIPGFQALCGLIRVFVDVAEEPPVLFFDVSNDQGDF